MESRKMVIEKCAGLTREKMKVLAFNYDHLRSDRIGLDGTSDEKLKVMTCRPARWHFLRWWLNGKSIQIPARKQCDRHIGPDWSGDGS